MLLSVRAAALAAVVLLGGLTQFAAADEAAAAERDRVELVSGDVLLGTITQRSEQSVTLEHPVLGTLEIPREQIASLPAVAEPEAEAEPEEVAAEAVDEAEQIADEAPAPTPAPAPAPEAADSEAQTQPAQVDAAADAAAVEPPVAEAEEKPSFLEEVRAAFEDWDMQLALGFADRASNVKSFSFHTRFNASYADDRDRWRLNAAYHRASTNSKTTRDDVRVFIQKDWLLPDSSWFFFGQTEYDYDTIKSWDHRLGAHGGMGYDLNEALGIDARLRGGFGVTKEFGGVEPKTRPESLLASEISLDLNETHSVAGSVQFMPAVDGSGYYRITSDANWDIKLSEELSLRFGVEHEYDNAVPAGFKKHDRRLTGSLVFKF